MGKVFGQMSDQGPTDADPNGGLTGGQLFARKALKGSLAGGGQALQQQDNPSAPPVDFTKLMTPTLKKKPLPQPQAPSSLYGD